MRWYERAVSRCPESYGWARSFEPRVIPTRPHRIGSSSIATRAAQDQRPLSSQLIRSRAEAVTVMGFMTTRMAPINMSKPERIWMYCMVMADSKGLGYVSTLTSGLGGGLSMTLPFRLDTLPIHIWRAMNRGFLSFFL